MAEYTALVRSPPDTVDDAHDFLRTVWAERPDVHVQERAVLETVLSELVTNVFQNNPHGQVVCQVSLAIHPGDLVLTTADSGHKLEGTPPEEMMPEVTAERGRGLALIRLMVDGLTYRYDGSLNIWQVRKSRRGG